MPASSNRSEALASAALRRIADAQRLLLPEGGSAGSFDQSWHLAGFGPECARKAALTSGQLSRILGHDLADADLTGWVLALDTATTAAARQPAPTGGWRPEHRYEATGTREEEAARALLRACEDDTLQILGRLWAEGLLVGGRC